MQAMVNVCSTNMWLKPAIAAIELAQMVVQGVWNEDSRLLQLPHFDKERSREFENEGVDDVFAFLDMEDETRKKLLEGLSEKEVEDIVMWCNDYPDIEVTAALASATARRSVAAGARTAAARGAAGASSSASASRKSACAARGAAA